MSGGAVGGGESMGLFYGAIVVVIFMTVGAPFALVHAYKLIGAGHTGAVFLYFLLGSFLSIPGVFLAWSGVRSGMLALGRRGR